MASRNEQGHGAAGAHRMFLENFLETPHLRDRGLLPEWPVLHHVAVFFRHERFKSLVKTSHN
jgi:hypothetical protein